MSRLVFDIETVGVPWGQLDEISREYLTASPPSPNSPQPVQEQLGFSPLTGQIAAIAIMNPDTGKGAAYYQAPGMNSEERMEGDVLYVRTDEEGILRRFWETVAHYSQFITFNGRAFDCPFIMVRSAIHKIRPTKNLVPYRYGDEHIDLLDRLRFFGAVQRGMSLHMWCQAFGIPSPKANGVSGFEVARLFAEQKYDDIARYCMDDIAATARLYEYWDKYINIR